MGELIEGLAARIAGCEARAGDIHEVGCFSSWWEHDQLGYRASECNCGEPQRVLAWCAAMRELVEEHATQNVPIFEGWGEVVMSGPECRVCADWGKGDMDGPPRAEAPCRTLELVAQALGIEVGK